jgi:hypothetical protein
LVRMIRELRIDAYAQRTARANAEAPTDAKRLLAEIQKEHGPTLLNSELVAFAFARGRTAAVQG